MPIPPYGGTLVDRTLTGDDAADAREKAASLHPVQLDAIAMSDVYLLAVGGFSPLTGFMGREDYESVLEDMTLANGLPWSVPITLPVDDVSGFHPDDEIALMAPDGSVAALMEVDEIYGWDRAREALAVYGTYEAREIFDDVDADQLGIRPLKFEHAMFCMRCDQMVSRGEKPPPEFSRPEVADVLMKAYRG